MTARRITADLPADLLDQAMKVTVRGITETLIAGLERLRRADAYRKATSAWIDSFAGRPADRLEEALRLPDAHVAQCALDRDALLLSHDAIFTRIAAVTPLRVARD